MEAVRPRRRRRMFGLVLALAVLTGLFPVGAALGDHTIATRVDVTFTSTPVEVIDPGEEWVDEAGIFHIRGLVEVDEIAGDATGTAEIFINVDAHPDEGWSSAWGTLTITDETGTWDGSWLNNQFVEGDEFFEIGYVFLTGRGGNAGMSITGTLTLDNETGVGTVEGVLQTMAVPVAGLTILQELCVVQETDFATITGGFLASGAIESSGSVQAGFEASGGIWTHTYNLAGATLMTDEHGSFEIFFLGGAQDGETYSGGWGPFMITGGDGAYAELYGYGRAVATAMESSTCASGAGFRLSYVGVAHFNPAIVPLVPIEE